MRAKAEADYSRYSPSCRSKSYADYADKTRITLIFIYREVLPCKDEESGRGWLKCGEMYGNVQKCALFLFFGGGSSWMTTTEVEINGGVDDG